MIMNRSRPLLNTVNDMKVYMSTKAKKTTHYDTLNIAPNSTQNDIKSAYYELTKKYHPDKNTSEEAKTKFQKVSNAYEVLSNFDKRKEYDRDLMARGDMSIQRPFRTPDDPMAGFYKSRKTTFTNERAQVVYDFDAWTKAHYGRTLNRSLRDKNNKILREKMQRQHQQAMLENKISFRVISSAVLLVMTILIVNSLLYQNYDKDLIDTKKKKSGKS